MRIKQQFLIDGVLLVALRPLLLGMAAIIIGATVFRSSSLPFDIAMLTIATGVLVSGAFLKARRMLIRDSVPVSWAHPLAALLSLTGYLFVIYNLAFTSEDFAEARLVGLTLLIIMIGALFHHLRWLLSVMLFIFASWTAVNLALGWGMNWRVYLLLFPIIGIASLAIFTARKHALSRMIDVQLENDLHNAQLAEALERAHRSEAQIKAERDLAGQVVDSMGQGLALLDDGGAIEYVNPAAVQMLGKPRDTLIGRMVVDVLTSKHDLLQERLAGGAGFDPEEPIEALIKHADGRVSHILAAITMRDSGGIILNLTDLTLRKEFEARLERLAHYDALTGLANRSLLIDRLRQALARIERRPTCVAVLFLDLDLFKPINDSAGHAVGDQVLIEIANRIQECVRPQDTVARVGGDEFVVVLVDLDNNAPARQIADRITRRVGMPVVIEGRAHTVAISIGIVSSETSDADPEELIRRADTAMYAAKRRALAGHNALAPVMRARAQRQLI